MAQSNYTLANKSAPASRAKINDVFESIATNNSGSSAPATTFPHQWWYDTTTNILKQRNAADSAWIDIGTFDQTGGTFVASVTQLTQTQAQDPTSTVFGTVSGQRLAQAFGAQESQIGVGQTWQDVIGSRAHNTSYQNTTGKPIMVSVSGFGSSGSVPMLQVSLNNSTWITVAQRSDAALNIASTIIPNNWYYRMVNTPNISAWAELR